MLEGLGAELVPIEGRDTTQAGDVERFIYAPSPVDEVYPGDYTGLPQ